MRRPTPFTRHAMLAIAAKASSLEERLTSTLEPIETGTRADDRIRLRMEAWRNAVSGGAVGSGLLERRLAWGGYSVADARRAVSDARILGNEDPLPPWVNTFTEILEQAADGGPPERCLDGNHPIPFEELLSPFVTWARLQCERRSGPAYLTFAPSATAALERQLLERLSSWAAPALRLEFAIDQSADVLMTGTSAGQEISRFEYDSFVAGMLAGRLLVFFEEYAALARVLSETTGHWVDAATELICRFHDDFEAVCDLAGASKPPRVIAVSPSMSDPHGGLRNVVVLTLSGGRRVVYKPRSLSMEAGWNELLTHLASIGAPAALRTYRVIDRGAYGWSEFVEYAPCADAAEAELYFERAGALLAIVHLLQGSDCHSDNIMPAGNCPVLIDVETMFSPKLRQVSSLCEAPCLAYAMLDSSVLSTFLLPIWMRNIRDGEIVDGSGFGASAFGMTPVTTRRWIHVNTDAMELATATIQPEHPRARLADGSPLDVGAFEATLCAGFATMYRFLMHRRQDLRRPPSPLLRLSGAKIRFVHRRTSLYNGMLRQLNQPDRLRDGVERSLAIERLAAAAVAGEGTDGHRGWAAIYEAERSAIERGDVPYFGAAAGQDGLDLGEGRAVPGWFAQSGHERALELFLSWSEDSLQFQIDLIRSSLRSRQSMLETGGLTVIARASRSAQDPLIGEAVAIAESIMEGAIRGSDGSLAWIEPARSRDMVAEQPGGPDLAIMGYDLYAGTAGVALFLAAVARISSREDFRSGALGALLPLVHDLEEGRSPIAVDMGIGGLSGLGSVVYGLARVARLLEEPQLFEAARQTAELITSERIEADTAYDVTLGSAGALLGLLALYGENPDGGTLERANRCGAHLVASLEPVDDQHRSIRGAGGQFLSGFSHGAAGMAYALCQLHAITHEGGLHATAQSLIQFERGSFSPEHGDWPDRRFAGQVAFARSWCHGAPGIALSRLACLPTLEDSNTQLEIDRALQLCITRDLPAGDFLCCGKSGVAGVLWSAGSALGHDDLRRRATAIAEGLIAEGRRSGYRLGVPAAGQLKCHGLFQGLAGIGYTLLRLARPDLFDVLLLR